MFCKTQFSMRITALYCTLTIVFCLAFPQAGAGQGTTAYPDSARALRTRLDNQVTASFEKSFGGILQSISRSQKLRIVLDRRINPATVIKYQAQDESVRVLLQKITAMADTSFCEIRGNIYVGPKATCHWLASLCELHQQTLKEKLSSNTAKLDAKRLLAASDIQWNYLSDPTDLIETLVTGNGLSISNPLLLKHDRWNANGLTNLPLSHKLTILLAGFDLTFEWNLATQSIDLRPFPSSVVLKTTIQKSLSESNLQKVKSALPDLKITSSDGTVSAEGRYEDIDRLNRLLAGERISTTTTTSSEKRFTLSVPKAPAKDILNAIANSRKLMLIASPEAMELLTKQIGVDVKEVTLEELLNVITKECGLMWAINGDKLEISK